MANKVQKMSRPSCLIVVPAYREHDNIAQLHEALEHQKLSYDLLVVDDGSDDGTQTLIENLQGHGFPVITFQRYKKLGLGSAYVLALAYARTGRYQYVVQMDADMSHRPCDVGRMIEASSDYDIVVGSRYTAGAGCKNWPWYRHLLSKAANWLARSMLHLSLADVTGGFRCIRRTFLENLPLEKITSEGFAFQYHFNYLAATTGARFTEIPICFHQRTAGKSKMSAAIMLEGLLRLAYLRYRIH